MNHVHSIIRFMLHKLINTTKCDDLTRILVHAKSRIQLVYSREKSIMVKYSLFMIMMKGYAGIRNSQVTAAAARKCFMSTTTPFICLSR